MDESMTDERREQLNSWNNDSNRWRIWDTAEYREYITEKYDAERYREFGHMNSRHPEFIASIDEFLENLKPVAEPVAEPVAGQRVEPGGETDWKAKYDALWSALQAKADERGWCAEFDEFSQQHDGPDRDVDKSVTMKIVFDIKRPYREDTDSFVKELYYSERRDLFFDAILAGLDSPHGEFTKDEIRESINNALHFGEVRLEGSD